MIDPVQLGLIAVSAALLLIIMAAVKWAGRHFNWSPEVQRKCVHVATGLYALTLPFTFSSTLYVLILLALLGVIMLALRRPQFAKTGLGSTLHSVDRKSYGELLLTISVGFIFYFSLGKPILYVLPILVLTLSDAAAALIGTHYGRKHFAVEAGTKSLEGVAMFFLVTWIVAMTCLLLLTDIDRANVVVLSLIVAAFGALVEADSWQGFDNLFVPVGLHLFLARYLDAPLEQPAIVAAIFIATLVLVLLAAPRLQLSYHAARAFTVFVFLVCTVTAPHNAILPGAAALAHLAARRLRPCDSRYPDLDFLALAASVALFWLFFGEYTAKNSLSAYNLTFAGMALISIVLAVHGQWLLSLIGGGVLFACLIAIASWNPAATQWYGSYWPWVVTALTLSLLIPMRWPEFLDRHRALRTLLLAAPVPLGLFISGFVA